MAVNFVRYGNDIPVMYENTYFIDMFTLVYKSNMTLFVLKSESKGRENEIYESSIINLQWLNLGDTDTGVHFTVLHLYIFVS